jgi:hypothetical protein
MSLLQWSKTNQKLNENCDVSLIKVASMSTINASSFFFFLYFDFVICLLAAIFFDEFFSTCKVVPLEVLASPSIRAGNLVGVGLQLFPTRFFVFSIYIVAPLVELTAFTSSLIMAGNLVGVGLHLFPTLFFVFLTSNILLVGIMLVDSVVFVIVVSFFLVEDLVDGGGLDCDYFQLLSS